MLHRYLFILMLAALTFSPVWAFARADSLVDVSANVNANVQNWNFVALHMDTGGVRSCSATGTFGNSSVVIGATPGGEPQPFASPGMGNSVYIAFTDPRYDAVRKTADTLTWKSGPAKLMVGGQEIASAELNYMADMKSTPPVIYKYWVGFGNIAGLKDTLRNAASLTITTEQKEFKPVELKDLNLKNVAEALQNCFGPRQ